MRIPANLELEKVPGLVAQVWTEVPGVPEPDPQMDAALDAVFSKGSVPLEARPEPAQARPRDPDKALTTFALGMFRFRGWPCRELEGFRAFRARVGFRDPVSGARDVCDITVSSHGGVLTFETSALELPPAPWLPLRHTLNELNLRSGGSVFLLRECGVVARHKLLPRPAAQGLFSVDGLMQALRQLNHDRRLALPLLRAVERGETPDAAAFERALQQPVAAHAAPAWSLNEVRDVAGLAGYFCLYYDGALYLNRQRCQVDACPVRVTARDGVFRGWTVPGEEAAGRWLSQRWQYVRQVIRRLRQGGPGLSPMQLGRLLERLNALNEASGLLRYVWTGGQVLALAVYRPAGPDVSPEEFQLFADALFRCAHGDTREAVLARRAV